MSIFFELTHKITRYFLSQQDIDNNLQQWINSLKSIPWRENAKVNPNPVLISKENKLKFPLKNTSYYF